jgi:hypothetical protein
VYNVVVHEVVVDLDVLHEDDVLNVVTWDVFLEYVVFQAVV